jgi:hypothetical protein
VFTECNPHKKIKKVIIPSSVADLDPGSGAFLTPGSGMGKIRIRIRDEQPGSYFRELRNFFGLKYLNFLIRQPGSGKGNIRIRDGKNSDPGCSPEKGYSDCWQIF